MKMKKMNCIAVDDERLALKKIRRYVDQIEYLNLVETFESPLDTLSFLRDNEVHLVFLDIEMDELTGIQLLAAVKNMPYVIITSAYKSYALKSFEFNVIDYLLKPIEFSRFVKAVEKVYSHFQKDLKIEKQQIRESQKDKISNKNKLIYVKDGRKMVKIDTDEILFIEGMKDYLRIHTANSRVLTLSNFDTIMNNLPEGKFVRIHKSYIISLDKIDYVEKNKAGIGKHEIPVGISYKMNFIEKYEDFKTSQS